MIKSLEKLKYCCIVPTDSCFMQCKMCYQWKFASLCYPNEPTFIEWSNFISSLRELVEFPFRIHFSGGEPLLKNNTIGLIKYASDLGFDTQLATNGYLINEEVAKTINDTGLNYLVISLDSLNEETHDFLRGKKGAYQKVMEAVRCLKDYCSNLTICICAVISGINMDGILDLVRWVQQNELIDHIGLQVIAQPLGTTPEEEWYKNKEYDFLWPQDIERAVNIIDELIIFKEDVQNKDGQCKLANPIAQLKNFQSYFKEPLRFVRRTGCPILIDAVFVNAVGDVFICNALEPAGNIKKAAIKDILFSENSVSIRTKMAQCKNNCMSVLNCNFKE